MELTADINYVAILVAAVANMAIGMFWYSPAGFGKQWMALTGMKMPQTPKEAALFKQKATTAMVGSFVASLIMAYVLAHFVSYLGLDGLYEGLQLGFWIWLGFVGSVTLSDHLYSDSPMPLYYLNTGYRLASFLCMGAILTLM